MHCNQFETPRKSIDYMRCMGKTRVHRLKALEQQYLCEADYRFKTQVQVDWYNSVFLGRTNSLTEMKWVDWDYLQASTNPVAKQVIKMCIDKDVGGIMCLEKDWNEELIGQFFATVFFEETEDETEQQMRWLTEGEEYTMTMSQFATILGLDALDLNKPNIHAESPMSLEVVRTLYADRMPAGALGSTKGLLPHYDLLLKLLKTTISPKSGDKTALTSHHHTLLLRMRENAPPFSIMKYIWFVADCAHRSNKPILPKVSKAKGKSSALARPSTSQIPERPSSGSLSLFKKALSAIFGIYKKTTVKVKTKERKINQLLRESGHEIPFESEDESETPDASSSHSAPVDSDVDTKEEEYIEEGDEESKVPAAESSDEAESDEEEAEADEEDFKVEAEVVTRLGGDDRCPAAWLGRCGDSGVRKRLAAARGVRGFIGEGGTGYGRRSLETESATRQIRRRPLRRGGCGGAGSSPALQRRAGAGRRSGLRRGARAGPRRRMAHFLGLEDYYEEKHQAPKIESGEALKTLGVRGHTTHIPFDDRYIPYLGVRHHGAEAQASVQRHSSDGSRRPMASGDSYIPLAQRRVDGHTTGRGHDPSTSYTGPGNHGGRAVEYLGVEPLIAPAGHKLCANFSQCPEDTDDDTMGRYCIACVLYIFGSILFPDSGGDMVSWMWLPLLADWDEAGSFAMCAEGQAQTQTLQVVFGYYRVDRGKNKKVTNWAYYHQDHIAVWDKLEANGVQDHAQHNRADFDAYLAWIGRTYRLVLRLALTLADIANDPEDVEELNEYDTCTRVGSTVETGPIRDRVARELLRTMNEAGVALGTAPGSEGESSALRTYVVHCRVYNNDVVRWRHDLVVGQMMSSKHRNAKRRNKETTKRERMQRERRTSRSKTMRPMTRRDRRTPSSSGNPSWRTPHSRHRQSLRHRQVRLDHSVGEHWPRIGGTLPMGLELGVGGVPLPTKSKFSANAFGAVAMHNSARCVGVESCAMSAGRRAWPPHWQGLITNFPCVFMDNLIGANLKAYFG
uniref:Aminotransferase-like plant mobile domain-containing protein n=1 Tax=Oryza brachyantha TaxID=4533 RepID=J3MVJ6_ORYBR